MTVHVLVTGASGQLGDALTRSAPEDIRITALSRRELDLTDTENCARVVREARPELIVNAAAYTAVDRAETERATAAAVNADGVRVLAQAAAECGARVVHISTDFVFGEGHGRPWRATDATDPQSVYGRTKRDGETAVLEILGTNAIVLRTSWVYAAHGSNFVKTMLRLMNERDEVRVIADQVGSPTWVRSLANTVWAAVARPEVHGVLHWSDAGVASWYDFAVAIQEEALERGLLSRAVPIHPIATADYPTPARRPAYSVLDTSETVARLHVTPVHWRIYLRSMLDELAHA